MLLSDMKIKHIFRGRTKMRISFQGEISQQGKHETSPQDQKDYGKNTSSIKESIKRPKGQW